MVFFFPHLHEFRIQVLGGVSRVRKRLSFEEVMFVWITVTQYGNLNQFAIFFLNSALEIVKNLFPVVPVFS